MERCQRVESRELGIPGAKQPEYVEHTCFGPPGTSVILLKEKAE